MTAIAFLTFRVITALQVSIAAPADNLDEKYDRALKYIESMLASSERSIRSSSDISTGTVSTSHAIYVRSLTSCTLHKIVMLLSVYQKTLVACSFSRIDSE